MNIAFIPIDNRPVCYTLPEQICAINKSIKLYLPERKFLGDLKKCADVEEIFKWLENLPVCDAIVMCLDTVAYGGLIPSRRSEDTFEQIKNRIEKLKNIIEQKNAKIYAFSSIMRISNNNINEEEKEYWNKWGKKIFNYSFCMDKYGTMCKKEVPDEILEDYLATRKRNFEINKLYLDWQKEGFFDTLVFSKDDCAEYGFNVQEAKALEKLGGFVKTGADEIPLTLLARAVNRMTRSQEDMKSDNYRENKVINKVKSSHSSRSNFLPSLKVAPIFLASEHKYLISNYEDVSIEKSVLGQLELAGCEVCEPDEADILLYVNNFEEHQGEIVMDVDTKAFSGKWQKPEKPYMIADVRFANGADNAFVEKLFDTDLDENFCGYSAWNTSANSLGSLICAAVLMRLIGQENNRANNCQKANSLTPSSPVFLSSNNNFKKVQAIRFLDDWAYQANVRQQLKKLTNPDLNKEIVELMKPFERKVFKKLNVSYNVDYKFPWNRLFEVEVEFN